LSSKTAETDNQIIIAEPAATSIGPATDVPSAIFIDLGHEAAVKAPYGRPSFVTKVSILTDAAIGLNDDRPMPSEVPLPRRKPAVRFAATIAGLGTFSANDELFAPSLQAVKNYGNWPKDAVSGAREKCERLLRGLDVKLKTKDPVGSPGGCGIAYPLSVSAIAGVAITPAATLNCEMVAALHAWITQVAQPTAKREFNTRLTGLQNASSFACRLRNNSSSGKLSEHALGNALDIADFRFSNRMEASVAGSWSGSIKGLTLGSRGTFLKQTRTGACKYFNTVLGPGSDPFHKDHLHLDLMKLRTGRGKYCR
jgi:hypothetical protein